MFFMAVTRLHPDTARDSQRAGARRLRRFIIRKSTGNHFIYARSDTEAA